MNNFIINNNYFKLKTLAIIIILNATSLFAIERPNIKIVGLFTDKIIVVIDGKHKILNIGDSVADGAILVEANSKFAIFDYNNQPLKYTISNHISSVYKPPEEKINYDQKRSTLNDSGSPIEILLDQNGQYETTVKINGKTTNAVIGTGANTVVINGNQAKQLGLKYKDPSNSTNTYS